MTNEPSKAAVARVNELLHGVPASLFVIFARYIDQVSEAAKLADRYLAGGFPSEPNVRKRLAELLLPDEEPDPVAAFWEAVEQRYRSASPVSQYLPDVAAQVLKERGGKIVFEDEQP